MKFLRKRNIVLTNVFSVLALAFVFFPLIAEDGDQYMKNVDQVMQTWGLRLQEKVAFQLQQVVATDIELQYEKQLVQQTSDTIEQVALAVSIDPETDIQVESGALLAQVVPAINEVECDD